MHVVGLADQIQGRQVSGLGRALAFGRQIDGQTGRFDGRIVQFSSLQGFIHILGQQLNGRIRLGHFQQSGRMAEHLNIIGQGGPQFAFIAHPCFLGGLQLLLGGQGVQPHAGPFGNAFIFQVQLILNVVNVAGGQANQVRPAQHVQIGIGGFQQHGLAGDAQFGFGNTMADIRLSNGGIGGVTVKKVLGHGHGLLIGGPPHEGLALRILPIDVVGILGPPIAGQLHHRQESG